MLDKKRSTLVVEPAIQYSLVRQLVIQWTLHLVTSILLLTMLQLLLGGLFQTWHFHVERLLPLVGSLTVTLIFLAPVFILSSLKLSNRFAGPIHRFRLELRRLADGKTYEPIAFRGDDYWKEIAEEFDRAVQTITDRASAASQQHATAEPKSGIVLPTDNLNSQCDAASVDSHSI